jgi:glycosyltransferase involved in cell wall biosynthesis
VVALYSKDDASGLPAQPNMSKITVVTPCYNSGRFIHETIASVRNQDVENWEYILVDDGSNDGTAEILAELAAADQRIKVLLQAHAGTCHARNLGASNCSEETRYLLFLDHDDALEPNALRILSEYLDAHARVCVAACQFQEMDLNGIPVGSRTRSRWVPSLFGLPRPLRADEYDTPFAAFYCCTGQGPFAMFRRSLFEQVGGWTTDFWPHEDTDLFCKMALRGQIHYLPERLYRKRTHSANALNDTSRLTRAYEAFRQKWDTYQPRDAQEAATLRDAAIFYRTSFRPLRHLKVGFKALGECVRSADAGKFRWALHLFAGGLRDLVRYRISAR